MNIVIKDKNILAKLPIIDTKNYLLFNGWEQLQLKEKENKFLIFTKKEKEVLLPLRNELGDFSERVYDLLDTLSKDEDRSMLNIYYDIITLRKDIN